MYVEHKYGSMCYSCIIGGLWQIRLGGGRAADQSAVALCLATCGVRFLCHSRPAQATRTNRWQRHLPLPHNVSFLCRILSENVVPELRSRRVAGKTHDQEIRSRPLLTVRYMLCTPTIDPYSRTITLSRPQTVGNPKYLEACTRNVIVKGFFFVRFSVASQPLPPPPPMSTGNCKSILGSLSQCPPASRPEFSHPIVLCTLPYQLPCTTTHHHPSSPTTTSSSHIPVFTSHPPIKPHPPPSSLRYTSNT